MCQNNTESFVYAQKGDNSVILRFWYNQTNHTVHYFVSLSSMSTLKLTKPAAKKNHADIQIIEGFIIKQIFIAKTKNMNSCIPIKDAQAA